MKNIINKILENKLVLLLLVLLALIMFLLSYRMVETFDTLGTTSSKPIPDQYKYLAPLPEGSVWSPEFQDKWIAKLKEKNPNDTTTKESLAAPVAWYGNKSLMQMASQTEAQYFLDNGLWPYDDYVTNFLKNVSTTPMSDQDLESTRKMFPNRFMYAEGVTYQTVPQYKMFDSIYKSFDFQKANNDKYWKCTSGTLQVKDGEAGTPADSTDYSFFPSNVQGFSFDQEPCNVCSLSVGGNASVVASKYNSPENTCKFSMSGEVPEAYNIYIGKYGTAPSESVPASSTGTSVTSDNQYSKCVSDCDKYK